MEELNNEMGKVEAVGVVSEDDVKEIVSEPVGVDSINDTNNYLELVHGSGLVSEHDINAIMRMQDELSDTFKSVQVHRTRTEMEVSVLNDLKFPTAASKYWQSVREQNVMFQELILLSYEYRKNSVEMKIAERNMMNEEDELEKELLQIEIDKKRFIQRSQERTAKARIREIIDWSDIKERESKKMNDNQLINVNNHQLISYTRRWIKQRISMGDNGSPAERQNLLGQLRSGIKACIKEGVFEELIEPFDEKYKTQIRSEYDMMKETGELENNDENEQGY